jgi:hypothetical protein
MQHAINVIQQQTLIELDHKKEKEEPNIHFIKKTESNIPN